MTFWGIFEEFFSNFSGLSQNFLRTLSGFYQVFCLVLSQEFFRTLSRLSQDFFRTFMGLSQDFLRTINVYFLLQGKLYHLRPQIWVIRQYQSQHTHFCCYKGLREVILKKSCFLSDIVHKGEGVHPESKNIGVVFFGPSFGHFGLKEVVLSYFLGFLR